MVQFLPRGKHTGDETTAAIHGHSVATPMASHGTIFIETAQVDERRDSGKCFTTVCMMSDHRLVTTELSPYIIVQYIVYFCLFLYFGFRFTA